MPRISPFSALRYTEAAGDPALLIAPPYDVIDADQAAELRGRSPYNAVRLVLPEGEGEARYAAAAERLRDWTDAGVVERDAEPGIYVYRQRYERAESPVERLALFGGLALEEPGRGVLPHERTHAGPKQDRLALTLATRTQLSPIFLLARDPEAALLEALRVLSHGEPVLATRTPDGIEHALWAVREEGAASVLCALAGRHPLLIADGHHRYETALEVARRLDGEAARSVLACIVSAEDPGLVIRPTHRTLTAAALRNGGAAPAALAERLAAWFEVETIPGLEAEEAEALAARDSASMIVLPGGAGTEPFRLSPRAGHEPELDLEDESQHELGATGGGRPVGGAGDAAAARIAAVRFDRHVVRGLLRTDADAAAREGKLEYHRGVADAVRRAGGGGAAFILPPVSLAALWEATAAGIRLPPKSTYFEPKIPSGLLFRPLD